jgi:hypothetical protein
MTGRLCRVSVPDSTRGAGVVSLVLIAPFAPLRSGLAEDVPTKEVVAKRPIRIVSFEQGDEVP